MTASGDSSLKKDPSASAERKQKLRAHVRSILTQGLTPQEPRPGGESKPGSR
ncbi:hypothetical protein ACN9MF_23855 [Methylobacterium fujisawaense]|uniref:hypothetical protein n=1 Tax=Methylobacterium fujisawaense TaxID=107400 RepID=UPI003CF3903D